VVAAIESGVAVAEMALDDADPNRRLRIMTEERYGWCRLVWERGTLCKAVVRDHVDPRITISMVDRFVSDTDNKDEDEDEDEDDDGERSVEE
jgi:hypothetical protein